MWTQPVANYLLFCTQAVATAYSVHGKIQSVTLSLIGTHIVTKALNMQIELSALMGRDSYLADEQTRLTIERFCTE